MAHVLHLSAEILIEIFSSLFFTDIFCCTQTCRTFSEVISNSSQLNYQIELQKAGMRDNPNCSLSLPDRLKMMKDRELAWATFQPKFDSMVQIPFQNSGLHDVAPGVFLLGTEIPDEEFEADGMQSVRLPSRDGEDVSTEWTHFDLGMKVLDFRPAIEEHDMLAFVVMVPDKENAIMSNIMVIFRQHSDTTKTPTAALRAEILVCRVRADQGVPEVSIEIAGENLAIIVMCLDGVDEVDDLDSADNLYIFNWKTGENKRSKAGSPIQIFNLGIVFLREDILLHPSEHSNALEVYYIPQSSSNFVSKHVRKFFLLGLPELSPDYYLSAISVRCDPGCTSNSEFPGYTPTSRPYVNDPEAAILILSLEPAHVRNVEEKANFVMIVHRLALLGRLGLPEQGKVTEVEVGNPMDFSYDVWGPPITRWFEVNSFCVAFTMNTSGQRYIQLRNYRRKAVGDLAWEPGEPRHTIHLFDFNPFHVKLMATHGLALLAGRRTISMNVVGEDELRVRDADKRTDQARRNPANRLPGKGVFKFDIRGCLPYVEILSEGGSGYHYDALFIDEERLMAIRTEDDTYRLKYMDIIYFG